jgi:polysaccharide pyruvyl transferase WcaK-like protein
MVASASESDARSIFEREGGQFRDGPIIGVGLRHEYWQGTEKDYEEYNQKIAPHFDALIEKLNAQILMIPNCTYTKAHPWQDDRKTHQSIRNGMKYQDKVICVESDLTVFETFSLYSLLDFHISNRRHSCVFAAMNGVPFMPLNVSLEGHMSPFVKELGLELMHSKFSESTEMSSAVLKVWEQREEITKTITENVPRLSQNAGRHIPFILERLP